MPTSRKPRRKHHQHRMATPLPGLSVLMTASARIEDKQPLFDDQVTDLAAAYWLALDAMARGTSGEEKGSWRFDGDALQATRMALALHDQQIVASITAQLRAAMTEVRRRIDDGCVYQAVATHKEATT